MGRRRLNTCLAATLLVTFVMALVVLVIIGGYKLNWDWAGFNGKVKSGKTLWDWLQLLVIPLALAIIAILFNRSERKNEQRIATDNQQEAALQEYIKDMSGLLLEKDLRKSEIDAEVRKIAHIRTLTVLHRLDNDRKMNIVQFLCESGLIDKNEPIVDLEGANLNRVHFFGVYLDGTSLKGAHLREAHLAVTPLRGTNLEGADLTKAVLSMSEVNKVDFRRAFIPKATYFVLNQPGKAFLSEYFEGMAKRWSKNNLLTEANLSHALLTEANLRGTNLTKADLHSAFLVNADLQKAQLSGANLHSAI